MSPSRIRDEFAKKGEYKELSTLQTQIAQLVKKGKIQKKGRGKYIADFTEK